VDKGEGIFIKPPHNGTAHRLLKLKDVGSIQVEEELVKRGVFHSGNNELYSSLSSFSIKAVSWTALIREE
jgi:hypothetical protein